MAIHLHIESGRTQELFYFKVVINKIYILFHASNDVFMKNVHRFNELQIKSNIIGVTIVTK